MKLIQTGERVTGQVISRVGEQRLASSSAALLQSAQNSQKILAKQEAIDFDAQYNKAAKEAEEQAGIDAVSAVGSGIEFDEDGADTVYAQQYNKTARVVALSNMDTQVQTFSKEAATKYSSDADGYQNALGESIKAFKSQYNLDAAQEAQLNLQVINENKKYLPSIMGNSVALQKQEMDTEILNNIDTQSNIATQNAYEGNQEAYVEGREIFEQKLEAAVMEGSLTGADAIRARNDMDKRHNIQTVNGVVDRGIGEVLSGNMSYGNQVNAINLADKAIDVWYEETAKTGMFTTDELNKQRDQLNRQLSATNKEVAKQRKAALDASYSSTRVQGTDVMDYKNKDDKKAIENFYSNLVGKDADIADPQVRLAAISLSVEKGIIPPSALSSIRRNSKSRDPERVLAASNVLMELIDKAPHLSEQFSEQEVATAALTTKLIRNGVNATDAVLEAVESQRLPAKERKEIGIRNATSDGTVKAYNKEVSGSLEDFLDDNLDPSYFNDPENNSAINSDYAFLHDHYMNTTGDYETATELTNKRMKTQYGVSYTNGSPEIQKLAPEMVLNHSNEPSEWINRSWANKKQDVLTKYKERYPNLQESDITYQVSSETERGDPIWKVYIKDSNGILMPLSQTVDGYWLPNRGVTKTQEESKTNYDNDVKTVRGREVLTEEALQRKAYLKKENQPQVDEQERLDDLAKRKEEAIVDHEEQSNVTDVLKQRQEELYNRLPLQRK